MLACVSKRWHFTCNQPYTFKEKVKTTAGAMTALAVTGWLAVIVLTGMSVR
jgi:hypothetical protein